MISQNILCMLLFFCSFLQKRNSFDLNKCILAYKLYHFSIFLYLFKMYGKKKANNIDISYIIDTPNKH